MNASLASTLTALPRYFKLHLRQIGKFTASAKTTHLPEAVPGFYFFKHSSKPVKLESRLSTH